VARAHAPRQVDEHGAGGHLVKVAIGRHSFTVAFSRVRHLPCGTSLAAPLLRHLSCGTSLARELARASCVAKHSTVQLLTMRPWVFVGRCQRVCTDVARVLIVC
jgi:hypothetical protein